MNCKEGLSKTCPHCSEKISSTLTSSPSSSTSLATTNSFAAHLASCVKRPIKCIRCGDQFPADVIVKHSRECQQVLRNASSSSSSSLLLTSPASMPVPPSFPPPSSKPTLLPSTFIKTTSNDVKKGEEDGEEEDQEGDQEENEEEDGDKKDKLARRTSQDLSHVNAVKEEKPSWKQDHENERNLERHGNHSKHFMDDAFHSSDPTKQVIN